MPKVTEQHREARRRQITGAAVRLFARKGFQGTSMADIIEASGLSAGAIYGHYKSKDELIQVAITNVLELRMNEIDSARRQTPLNPPGEMLRILIDGMQAEAGDVGILLQVWAQAALDPSMRVVTDRVGKRLRTVFGDYLLEWYRAALGLGEDDARRCSVLYANLYLGLLQGYVVQGEVFSDFDREGFLTAASGIRPDLAVLESLRRS